MSIFPKKGRGYTVDFAAFDLLKYDYGYEREWYTINQSTKEMKKRSFGATYAYAVLGPDLKMPGGEMANTPNVDAPLWNGRPKRITKITFNEDKKYEQWIRGHLINGRWGGTGSNWRNLVMLTNHANKTHRDVVESFIDAYLKVSRFHEQNNKQDPIYGIYYLVRCSEDSFAGKVNNFTDNIYSYAPHFIEVSWRAIEIQKPIVDANARSVYLNMGNLVHSSEIPFLRSIAGKHPGMNIYKENKSLHCCAYPDYFPKAIKSNGVDGCVRIYQQDNGEIDSYSPDPMEVDPDEEVINYLKSSFPGVYENRTFPLHSNDSVIMKFKEMIAAHKRMEKLEKEYLSKNKKNEGTGIILPTVSHKTDSESNDTDWDDFEPSI